MAYGIRLRFEPLKSLNGGGITGSFLQVGDPFAHPIRILIIKNDTTGDLIISDNGVDDHLFLDTGQIITINISSNKITGDGLFFASGMALYNYAIVTGKQKINHHQKFY